MTQNTMKKKGVLQMALQLTLWVVEDTYNSLYLYAMSANQQLAWVTKLQLIIYMVQFITIQL
jgi:hypothetical protein